MEGFNEFSPHNGSLDHGKEDFKKMRDELLYIFHPDLGGSNEKASIILAAYKQALEGNGEALQTLYNTEMRDRVPNPEQAIERVRGVLVSLRGDIETFFSHTEGEKHISFDGERCTEKEISLLGTIYEKVGVIRGALYELEKAGAFAPGELEHARQALEEEIVSTLNTILERFDFAPADHDRKELQTQYQRLLASLETFILFLEEKYDVLVHGEAIDQSQDATQEPIPEEEGAIEPEEEIYDQYDDDDEFGMSSTGQGQKVTSQKIDEEIGDEEDEKALVEIEDWEPNEANAMGEMIVQILTQDLGEANRYARMMNKGFMRGSVVQRGGMYTVNITHQVLPWCGAKKEEFFLNNAKRHGFNSHFFETVKNPKTGDYFPEAVFLDTTGKALNLFLKDRFDEYPLTDEGKEFFQKAA